MGVYLRHMPANEALLVRVCEALENVPGVEEKAMFRGVTFMVDGKMCVSVSGNELMCRIGPDAYDEAIEQPGTRAMLMGGREYRGYLYVDLDALSTKAQLDHWVGLCLAFNPVAEVSKKKKPGESSRRAKS